MTSGVKKITSWVLPLLIVGSIGGAILTTAVPQTASAVAVTPDPSCNSGFLGFPAWYDGLAGRDPTTKDCDIISPENGNLSPFIWRIVMNVIEMALVLLGYISAGFILYGGFIFLTSNGKPDKAMQARKTILDAVVGLAVAMASIAIVNFIANNIK